MPFLVILHFLTNSFSAFLCSLLQEADLCSLCHLPSFILWLLVRFSDARQWQKMEGRKERTLVGIYSSCSFSDLMRFLAVAVSYNWSPFWVAPPLIGPCSIVSFRVPSGLGWWRRPHVPNSWVLKYPLFVCCLNPAFNSLVTSLKRTFHLIMLFPAGPTAVILVPSPSLSKSYI